MGTFMEEITLENSRDRGNADCGLIKEDEIHILNVQAKPDTGAWTLVINEDVREKLGLAITGERSSRLADGKASQYPITEAVTIKWKDRSTALPALVISGAKNVLLGALPLEAMDLIVDPVHQTLAGAHGDIAVYEV